MKHGLVDVLVCLSVYAEAYRFALHECQRCEPALFCVNALNLQLQMQRALLCACEWHAQIASYNLTVCFQVMCKL